MKRRTIPKTDSIRELAAFWDTHDVTDFDGQLEEVSQPIFQRRPQEIALEFALLLVPVELFPASAQETRAESWSADGVLRIESFVPADKLPPAALSFCSRLEPGVGGRKAYRLLVEGMRAAGCRALVRSVSRGGEQRFFLRLLDNTLILERLTRSKARIAQGSLAPVHFKRGEIDLARQVIEEMVVEECDPEQWSVEGRTRKAPIQTSAKARVVSLDDWIAKRLAPPRNRIPQVKARKGRRAQ